MKTQIEEATCKARCRDIDDPESKTECLELCRQSLSNPDSPVCRVSFLCPLCRRACGLEYPDTRFSFFQRAGDCHSQISWGLDKTGENIELKEKGGTFVFEVEWEDVGGGGEDGGAEASFTRPE